MSSGYLVNLLSALAVIALVYFAAQRAGATHPWLPSLLTALTPYLAYWAWSGMESSLAACAVLVFIFSAYKFLLTPQLTTSFALWLATLALACTRPEMMVVGGVFFVIAAFFLRKPALLLFLTAFIALALWRYNYVSGLRAKSCVRQTWHARYVQLQRGIDYFLRLFRHPLSVIGILITLFIFATGCVKHFQRKKNVLPFLCCLGIALRRLYITSGGDWMKEGRFVFDCAAGFHL
ncbi:MAG: hypothetical protein R3E67_03465 [Pseudomonadales bacterium]